MERNAHPAPSPRGNTPSRRRFLKSAAALAGGILAGGAAASAARLLRRPNVLLICIDALRADRLGCMGYGRPLTPFIDSLAARGILFADAVASSSWTRTAVATMLTGLRPCVHSVIEPENPLPDGVPALATVLDGAGYETFCIQTNPWLGLPDHGFQQGFSFFRFLSREKKWGNRVNVPGVPEYAYVSGVEVAKRFEKIASGLTLLDRPFFGYVHLMDVHGPYLPPAPYDALFSKPSSAGVDDVTLASCVDAMSAEEAAGLSQARRARLVDLYDGGVRCADSLVERMVAAVEAQRLGRGTLVVVCADHGEELFDHGRTGHAKTLYNEVLAIPLVMAGAGLPRGVTVSERVLQEDIAPTVLDIAGVAPGCAFDGASVLPLVSGAPRDPETAVNLSFLGGVAPVRQRAMTTLSPHLKVIETLPPQGPRLEVYNLHSDPGEHADLAASDTALASGLMRRLNRMVDAASGRAWAGGRVEIDAETREQLRALGYLH